MVHIKRLLKVFLIGSIFVLAGCTKIGTGQKSPYGNDVNQLEGVSIDLDETEFKTSGNTLDLKIHNTSDEEYYYGAEYSLEYLEDDVWHTIETEDDMAVIAIAYVLVPNDTNTDKIDLSFYEPLRPGTYRIIKMIGDEPLTAEFTVK